MKHGVYPSMPDAEYRATRALSCSTLKRFAEAPAKAHVGRTDSAALRDGRLIHTATLEAHTLEARYAVTDLDRRGTKAWQEEEAAAVSSGRELLKRGDFDLALRVRDAVMSHPIARDLLAPGMLAEASVFWQDRDTGLECRARMDVMRPTDLLLADVKTTQNASADDFGRSAAKFLYHWQAVFYRDGITKAPGGFRPKSFFFIVVEKEAPHLCAVYEMSRAALDQAERDVAAAMQEYAECLRANNWPGYPETVVTLDLPAWAYDEGSIYA